MSSYDKVKIVIVGDSGVGKTSVVHMICHNESLHNPSWTVGCGLEVKLHEYKGGTPAQKNYFIDFWDIGGSASHRNSRGVFYNGVNGIILVHDLTNRKSEVNLHKWIIEILNRDTNGGPPKYNEDDFDPETFIGSSNNTPILVIGTKLDALEKQTGRKGMESRISSIAEECRADEIFANSMDPKCFAAGSTGAVRLARFFDTVIERRFYKDSSFRRSHHTTFTSQQYSQSQSSFGTSSSSFNLKPTSPYYEDNQSHHLWS